MPSTGRVTHRAKRRACRWPDMDWKGRNDGKTDQPPRVASPRVIACPNADGGGEVTWGRSAFNPSAICLPFLPGAATGPCGTSPVSAVLSFFDAALMRRCLGASFAGTRVTRTGTSCCDWIWRSRCARVISFRAAVKSLPLLDFVGTSGSVGRSPRRTRTTDCLIRRRTC